MLTTAAGTTQTRKYRGTAAPGSSGILMRKIWLPKALYEALPYFYVLAGIGAFLATLYISDWFWVLPHYILFSVGCVHLGLYVYNRRSKRPEDA